MPYVLNGAPLTGDFVVDGVRYPANVLDLWSEAELGAIGVVWAPPPTPGLADRKAARLEDIADRRRLAAQNFSLPGGGSMRLDPDTENAIAKAIQGLERQPVGATILWEISRGVVMPLDLPALYAIGDAAFLHVQACFARVATLTAEVMAAEDEAALEAIDINAGWPG